LYNLLRVIVSLLLVNIFDHVKNVGLLRLKSHIPLFVIFEEQYLAIMAIRKGEYNCKVSSKNSKRLLKNLQNMTRDYFLPHPVDRHCVCCVARCVALRTGLNTQARY